MTRWLVAFAWTLALELPVYTLLLERHVSGWRTLCALVVAVNAITHPLLWFVFPRLSPYAWYLLAGEACVTVAEAALVLAVMRPRRPGRALAASLAANAVSTVLGLGLMRILLG